MRALTYGPAEKLTVVVATLPARSVTVTVSCSERPATTAYAMALDQVVVPLTPSALPQAAYVVPVPVQQVLAVVSRSASLTDVTPEPESEAVPQAPGAPAQVLAQRPAAGPMVSL